MTRRLAPLVFALLLVGVGMTSPASAQTNLNNRTLVTFSQPVEVPGKILPAGTYTFELNDSMANRHIVHIFDEGGTKLQAIVLAIPNRRAVATDETVITFAEVPAGQPQAIREWFYPGQVMGHEMVYSRTRAAELVSATHASVPSVDDSLYVDVKADTMKTADIAPVTVDRRDTTIAVTTPTPVEPVRVDTTPTATTRTELPRTASALPLVALFGIGTIGLGMVLRRFSTRRTGRTTTAR